MFTVTTNTTNYTVGETVVIRLTLTNDTDQTQTYDFGTAQRYDVIVSRNDQQVWQWSADQFFAQMMGSETLEPGESRTYTVPWNQVDANGRQVRSGTYTVTGTITSYNLPQSDSTEITIR